MTRGDVARDFGFGRRAGDEIGHRDRHRLRIALGDVDADAPRRPAARPSDSAPARRRRASRRRRLTVQTEMIAVIGLIDHRAGMSLNICAVSKVKSISFQCRSDRAAASCRAGRRSTARTALSRMALKRTPLPLVSTIGGAASVPSRLKLMRMAICRSLGVLHADRRIPQRHRAARAARRSRTATASRRCPMAAPSEGAVIELVAGRGVALRLALVEQRGDLVGVEFRLRLRRRRLLRRQRRRLRLRPASVGSRLLELLGDRIGLRLRLRRRLLRPSVGLSSGFFSARPSASMLLDRLAAPRPSSRPAAWASRPAWARPSRPWSSRRIPCR